MMSYGTWFAGMLLLLGAGLLLLCLAAWRYERADLTANREPADWRSRLAAWQRAQRGGRVW